MFRLPFDANDQLFIILARAISLSDDCLYTLFTLDFSLGKIKKNNEKFHKKDFVVCTYVKNNTIGLFYKRLDVFMFANMPHPLGKLQHCGYAFFFTGSLPFLAYLSCKPYQEIA